MVELNLDGDALKVVAAQAILDQLTPEKKEDLIRQSIVNLITPEKRSSYQFGAPTSTALQDAFDHAVSQIAQEVLKEALQEDSDVMNKIHSVIQKGIEEAFSEGVPETAHAIAGAVRRVFTPAA